MKKYLALILIVALCAALFVSCKGGDTEGAPESGSAESTPAASVEESTEPEYEFEVDECSHNFSDIWNQNSVYHWHICDLCGLKTDINEHSFKLELVVVEPTESENGTGFFACEDCGILVEMDIAKGTVPDTEK